MANKDINRTNYYVCKGKSRQRLSVSGVEMELSRFERVRTFTGSTSAVQSEHVQG